MTPGVDDIREARRRIQPYIRATPLIESLWLTEAAGSRVSLKVESLQKTGAFKIRGALNALLRLPAGTRVVTASAGNHGYAIACASKEAGLQAFVFTPRDAPETKLRGIQRYGATLDRTAVDYDEAERRAHQFARESGATYISSYNHPDVIAGGGTIALEIAESAPDADVLIAPLGGGGLLGGLAVAAHGAAPHVAVVGVEAAASTAFADSLAAGRIVTIEPGPTLADGLSGNLEPDAITFPLVQQLVHTVVTVTEDEIANAIRGLAERERLVVEGSGAVGVAALLSGKVRLGRHAVAVVSGGNIDLPRFIEVTTRPDRQAPRG